jgi:hypothetical protein
MSKFKWKKKYYLIQATNGDVLEENHILYYRKVKLITVFLNCYKKYSIKYTSDECLADLMSYKKQFKNLVDCKSYAEECILKFSDDFYFTFNKNSKY